MNKKPSRRQYLATLGGTSLAGIAGCSQINSQQPATEASTRELGGANFAFDYNSQEQQVTIQYNGGATIQAGNLQVRSSSGMQTSWSQLGSTTTGSDAQLSDGVTAVIGPNILNWEQAVGPNETIRLVFAGGDGPSTLGRFTPPESSTLTSTVPPTDAPTEASTETPTEEPDTTAPSITAFSISNPSGQDLRTSFDSDERLSTIQVSISGVEETTLVTSDFSETTNGGTYTYEANYDANSDGTYTATLNEAADSNNNNGADESSVSISIETSTTAFQDDFEYENDSLSENGWETEYSSIQTSNSYLTTSSGTDEQWIYHQVNEFSEIELRGVRNQERYYSMRIIVSESRTGKESDSIQIKIQQDRDTSEFDYGSVIFQSRNLESIDSKDVGFSHQGERHNYRIVKNSDGTAELFINSSSYGQLEYPDIDVSYIGIRFDGPDQEIDEIVYTS